MALPNNITQSDIINYLNTLPLDDFIAIPGMSDILAAISPTILQNKITIATSQVAATTVALANAQTNLSNLQS